jgi:hypothetical protein
MMDEWVSILGGLLLGLAFASGLPWLRSRAVRACLIAAVGVSSTWASGEYIETWWFVAPDIGQVALAAVASWWLVRHLRGVWAPMTLES